MPPTRPRFNPRPPPAAAPRLLRLVVGLIIAIVAMYFAWQKSQEDPRNLGGPPGIKVNPPVQPEQEPPAEARPVPGEVTSEKTLPNVHIEPERVIQTQIKNAVIRNQDGQVVFRGTVDLSETLARIERGERGRGNDGTVFQNREKRLPSKRSGYYHEWVHPTRGESGPGPQRIITGDDGEIYYTPDHYKTFQRLDSVAKQGGGKQEARGERRETRAESQ